MIGLESRVLPVAVRADGWGWRYAGRRHPAVRNIDLAIEPGEKVMLLGASGSGKSTLLAALAGVLGDDEGSGEGELRLDGRWPSELRGRAGLVLQDPDSQVVLARVGDDVAFGCENLGVPRDEIWPRVRAALDAVGLEVPLDFPAASLSGGQKQRLALAGVLAMRPGLLLLDEPTANLDPDGVREVRDAVERAVAATGATLVVIEHRVDVWADVVDRVVVLGAADTGGGVIADGPAARVLAEEGSRLAAGGVWVPLHLPDPPVRAHAVPPQALLSAEALSVGRNGVAVARGIDTTVRAGRLLGVRGPNGSGKTTLALTLAGLIPPVDGVVRSTEALSRGARPDPIRWSSRQLLGRIGTVFQDPEHQLLAATVRAELEVGPRAQGLRGADLARRVEPLLERLRLSSLASANPFTLSGGEKRRLSVATILAAEPRVLVLDEPTFGQDARTWAELVALLAGLLDRGLAAVAVSHDEHFLDALADDSLVLGS